MRRGSSGAIIIAARSRMSGEGRLRMTTTSILIRVGARANRLLCGRGRVLGGGIGYADRYGVLESIRSSVAVVATYGAHSGGSYKHASRVRPTWSSHPQSGSVAPLVRHSADGCPARQPSLYTVRHTDRGHFVRVGVDGVGLHTVEAKEHHSG